MKASFGEEPEEPLRYPEWQKSYQQALVELDDAKLQQRVSEAETTILKRLQDISRSPDRRMEREAIENALGFLRVLKREKVEYTDGKAG